MSRACVTLIAVVCFLGTARNTYGDARKKELKELKELQQIDLWVEQDFRNMMFVHIQYRGVAGEILGGG